MTLLPIERAARIAFGEKMQSATEREYNLAIGNAPRARKSHIEGGPRLMDVEWKDRGTLVAAKSIMYTRGKVSQEIYRVNPDYLPGGSMARRARFPEGKKMTVEEVAAVVGPEFKEMHDNPPESVKKMRKEMEESMEMEEAKGPRRTTDGSPQGSQGPSQAMKRFNKGAQEDLLPIERAACGGNCSCGGNCEGQCQTVGSLPVEKAAASQWIGYIEDPDGYMARFFGPSSKGGISRKRKNLPLPEGDWDSTMVGLDHAMGDFYSFLSRKPSNPWFRNLPPNEKKVLDGLLAEYSEQNKKASSLLPVERAASEQEAEKLQAEAEANEQQADADRAKAQAAQMREGSDLLPIERQGADIEISKSEMDALHKKGEAEVDGHTLLYKQGRIRLTGKQKLPEELEEHQFTSEDNPNPKGSDKDGDGKTNEPSPVPAKKKSSRRLALQRKWPWSVAASLEEFNGTLLKMAFVPDTPDGVLEWDQS